MLVFAAGTVGGAVGLLLPELVSLGVVDGGNARLAIGIGALTFGVLVTAGAVAGDLLGHVRVQFVGAVLFTVASLGAATTTNPWVFLVALAVQGAGAALAVPAVVGYARAQLPAIERAVGYALFALAFVAGPPLGVLLNQELVENVDWHALFWILTGAGALAAGTGVGLLRQRIPVRIDPARLLVALLATGGALGILLPLTGWDVTTWPAWVAVPVGLGVLLFAGCLVLEGNRQGWRPGLGAPLIALLVTAGAAHLTILVIYLEVVAGESAHSVALLGYPIAACAVLGAGTAVVLAMWVDGRIAVAAGAALMALGMIVPLIVLIADPASLRTGLVALDAAAGGLGLTLVIATLMRRGQLRGTGQPSAGQPSGWPAIAGQPGGWPAIAGQPGAGQPGAGQPSAWRPSVWRPSAGPGPVFAALAIGTASAGALSSLLFDRQQRQLPYGSLLGGGLSSMRNTAVSVMIASIALLAGAVILALLLGPRGTESAGPHLVVPTDSGPEPLALTDGGASG